MVVWARSGRTAVVPPTPSGDHRRRTITNAFGVPTASDNEGTLVTYIGSAVDAVQE
jgi:hypothetical protein